MIMARGIVDSSAEIQRAYAVQPGEDIAHIRHLWFDRIHPEDRPRVQAQFEQCMHEKTEYRAKDRTPPCWMAASGISTPPGIRLRMMPAILSSSSARQWI